MISLPTFLTGIRDQSVRRWGPQRNPASALSDCIMRLREVDQEPSNVFLWVNLIITAMEGAIHAGNTPYAICQAMVNKLHELESGKVGPPLPHMGGPYDR